MVLQLHGIAGQIRSKVDDVLNNVKKGVSSTPLDPDDLDTSSCSPEEVQPNDSERGSKLIDSVVSTLFAACTGNNCPPNDEELVESLHKKRPTKLGKKARMALHTLQHSSSRDECHYAQFYEDDHGLAARAVLMARKRETRERNIHRQKLKELHQNAIFEAQPEMTRGNKNNNTNSLNRSNIFDDSASALSYSFDDGISALTIEFTLEEMAKAELILQRERENSRPKGFESIKENLPPSPASTVGTSDSSGDAAQSPLSERVDLKNKQPYPVQMARPRSLRSSPSSSQSDFMEWKNQDAKYWTQVVENENNVVESTESVSIKLIYYYLQNVTFSHNMRSHVTTYTPQKITSPSNDKHPHDTSVDAVSLSAKKKSRKPRTPKLFNRRKKKYLNVTNEEEHEI
jgi:hypothetical protein